MIRGLLVLAFLAVLIIAGLYALAALDSKSSHFDNRIDAQEIVAKGWLPRALPSGASEIWEVHSLDTNHGYGGFNFTEIDIQELKEDMVAVSLEPKMCNLPWDEMLGEGREWYETEYFFVAIDWRDTDAKFWLCYRRGV